MTKSDTSSSLEAWTLALARPTITPAGGSAAAIGAALAASLVAMVAGITSERERYAAVHAEAARLRGAAEQFRTELLELACEDARVFGEFGDALKLPTGTDAERTARDTAKRRALAEGARVQMDVLRRAVEVGSLSEAVAVIAPPSTVGDAATAMFLATGAARSAYWAIRSDIGGTTDDADRLFDTIESAQQRMVALLRERLR